MITVETPLRSIKAERTGLEVLLVTKKERRDFILGALAILDWIELGASSPLENMSRETADALRSDQ
jgi:hypothetical protein